MFKVSIRRNEQSKTFLTRKTLSSAPIRAPFGFLRFVRLRGGKAFLAWSPTRTTRVVHEVIRLDDNRLAAKAFEDGTMKLRFDDREFVGVPQRTFFAV